MLWTSHYFELSVDILVGMVQMETHENYFLIACTTINYIISLSSPHTDCGVRVLLILWIRKCIYCRQGLPVVTRMHSSVARSAGCLIIVTFNVPKLSLLQGSLVIVINFLNLNLLLTYVPSCFFVNFCSRSSLCFLLIYFYWLV